NVRPSSEVGEVSPTLSLQWNGIAILGVGGMLIVFGIFLFIGATNADNQKSATATAYTMRLSATPNTSETTATAVAGTATATFNLAMITEIQAALVDRIPAWKQVKDHVMHVVPSSEANLGFNVLNIDYGYCDKDLFYAYIWTKITDTI